MCSLRFPSPYNAREKRARFCGIRGPRVPLPLIQYIRLWRPFLRLRHDGVIVTVLRPRAPQRYFELNGSWPAARVLTRNLWRHVKPKRHRSAKWRAKRIDLAETGSLLPRVVWWGKPETTRPDLSNWILVLLKPKIHTFLLSKASLASGSELT